MRVVANIDFKDLKADVMRKKGEQFTVSKERFEELQDVGQWGNLVSKAETKKKD